MSAFAEFLAQIVQQQAAHNRRAAEVTTRKPVVVYPQNEKLREAPMVPTGPDDMPVFRRPYAVADDGSRPEGFTSIVGRVRAGKPVPPSMVAGMQPHEILDAFKVGAGLAPPSDDVTGTPAPTPVAPPTPQVSPDMLYVPDNDPRAMPGSRSHPVERAYGRIDSLVQGMATPEHPAGRYVEPMFNHPGPDGQFTGPAMTYPEAAQLIAGQLTARRMRTMGAQDPSMRIEQGILDPMLLATMPGQSF